MSGRDESESTGDKFMSAAKKRGVIVPPPKPPKTSFDDRLKFAAERRKIAYVAPAPLPKSGKTVYITGDTMAGQRKEDPAEARYDFQVMLEKKNKSFASAKKTMDELIREQEKRYTPAINQTKPFIDRVKSMFRK